MTTTEQALQGARRVARRAAQLSAGLGSCPYPADGTAVQLACRRAWIRTYLHWRPGEAAPVDYGDDVTALADGPEGPDTDGGAGAGSANQGAIILGGNS